VLPELTELDGDPLGVGVTMGEAVGVGLVEEWALEEAEALPVAVADALPVPVPVALAVEVPALCGVALSVGEAVALGELLGVLVGAASIASHSLSMIESVDTMVFASVRLVAVIEPATFDCSLVGSPETVTVALAYTCESFIPASE
jgi:hypothetical protein